MKTGENLQQIALRYGMSIETLRSVNGIGPRQTVPTGYALLVPMQRPSAEAAESLEDAVFTTVPAGRTFFYTVHRGDTLTSIAARYGVTTQDLKRWNRLARDDVRRGEKLRVTSDAVPVRAAHGGGRSVHAKARSTRPHRQATAAVRNASGGGGRGRNKAPPVTTSAAKATTATR